MRSSSHGQQHEGKVDLAGDCCCSRVARLHVLASPGGEARAAASLSPTPPSPLPPNPTAPPQHPGGRCRAAERSGWRGVSISVCTGCRSLHGRCWRAREEVVVRLPVEASVVAGVELPWARERAQTGHISDANQAAQPTALFHTDRAEIPPKRPSHTASEEQAAADTVCRSLLLARFLRPSETLPPQRNCFRYYLGNPLASAPGQAVLQAGDSQFGCPRLPNPVRLE